MVLHKDSGKNERWEQMKETNPILRSFVSLRQAYDESENPVVSGMRSVTDTIGGWFEETEHAQVQRRMKLLDPTFTLETFERELREYIIPEVVDAYLTADQESLKAWCSEAVSCAVYRWKNAIGLMHADVDVQRVVGNHGAVPAARARQRQQGTGHPASRCECHVTATLESSPPTELFHRSLARRSWRTTFRCSW